ncbi:hypothetical protein GCM10022206_22230 [Streptomyces chiangmaiensis]
MKPPRSGRVPKGVRPAGPCVPERLNATGLNLSSVSPAAAEGADDAGVGALSIAFIFIGRFGLNLMQSISTFATMITTCTTP